MEEVFQNLMFMDYQGSSFHRSFKLLANFVLFHGVLHLVYSLKLHVLQRYGPKFDIMRQDSASEQVFFLV